MWYTLTLPGGPAGPWLSVAFPVCTCCPFRFARTSSSLNTASLGSHMARAPINRWGHLAQLRLSPNRWLDSHRELPRGVYLGSLHSTERVGMFYGLELQVQEAPFVHLHTLPLTPSSAHCARPSKLCGWDFPGHRAPELRLLFLTQVSCYILQ